MVIHYDPWWNVAAQNQATDRAHRIGQEKQVVVFRLITRDTIEENIVKLQKAKESLAEQVVTVGIKAVLTEKTAASRPLFSRNQFPIYNPRSHDKGGRA